MLLTIKFSILDQIANHLNQQGHSAKIINENNKKVLLISTSLSRVDLAIEINKIFISLRHPEQQFIIQKIENILDNARIADLECSHSDPYDSGGVWCTNWLCIGDRSYSILSSFDCYGSQCFLMETSCLD